ncbi:MAG: hypothetical protein LBG45_03650 [Dysgonamonadaceae bacterium]|nr:hypothetical protein [Dysgonamonadaceae bacterium]
MFTTSVHRDIQPFCHFADCRFLRFIILSFVRQGFVTVSVCDWHQSLIYSCDGSLVPDRLEKDRNNKIVQQYVQCVS